MRNDTRHLLSNPRNARRLLEAIAQLDRGEGTEYALRDGGTKV